MCVWMCVYIYISVYACINILWNLSLAADVNIIKWMKLDIFSSLKKEGQISQVRLNSNL